MAPADLSVFNSAELDRRAQDGMTYPYVEEQKYGREIIWLYVHCYRSEDWFGYLGWLRKCGTRAAALDGMQKFFDRYRQLIPKGGVAFDCGANEGYYTTHFAKAVGSVGRVWAFEPDPRNVEVMRKNLQLNGLQNVIIIPQAVVGPDDPKTVSFASEVIDGTGEPALEVDTCTLDSFSHLQPNFIKVDVEGYELPLVRGAHHLIQHTDALWEMELHLSQGTGIHMTKRFGFDPKDIYSAFRREGYTITRDGVAVNDGEEPDGAVYIRRTR